MECEHIREYLVAYHQGELTPEEEAVIEEHVQTCSTCKQESAYIKKTNQPKDAKKNKNSWILAGIIILFFSVAVFILSDGEGASEPAIGRNLNISSVYNDIKITITDLIADDIQTVIHYEIEDLSKESLYQLGYDVDINVTIDDEEAYHDFFMDPLSFTYDNTEESGYIQTGVLHTSSFVNEEGLIELDILNVVELVESSVDGNPDYSHTYEERVEGEWQFEIPFIKQKSIVKELDEEVEIAGVSLVFHEMVIAPTTTILVYNYDGSRLGDVYMDFSSLSTSEHIYERTQSNYAIHYGSNHELHFEPMYNDIPEQIFLDFNSIHIYSSQQTNFDLNSEGNTQTVEFLGTEITIDWKNEGNETIVEVTEEFSPDRSYESLQFDIRFEELEISTIHWDQSGKIVDRNGEVYDAEDVYEIWHELDQPRWFTEHTEIRVTSENYETVTPKSLEIYGYDNMIFLDDKIKLNLSD
ncbi:hypothetical protein J2T56_002003 [Natronobacillus azotifigens]|uniref:Anti-sigma-W factor RsiW n=1 Tax=Natronobacillus azotifigens TaxID=472978 RepID=A0A9J6RDH2_9BACI|nr:zf-HC2 domain-containing protein [Natronobacillus azotifigens]